jgi:hypothetical protein
MLRDINGIGPEFAAFLWSEAVANYLIADKAYDADSQRN